MANTALQDHTLPSVGQILKDARQSQGLSLEEIAVTLCISKRYLAYLEDDKENLVGDVYTIGFLRSYAQYLGLDHKDLSKMFKNQAIHPPPSQLPFPAPLPGKGIPSFRVLGFCFFILLAVIGGWKWNKYSNLQPALPQNIESVEISPEANRAPQQENTLPLSETLLKASTPPKENLSPDTLIAAPQTPILPPSVFLKATEEAWIEVTDQKGDVILSHLFKPKESYEFKNPQHLILKTGNAGGLSLFSGEKSITSLGKSGEVKSGVSLDPEKWVEQTPETH